jgi:5-methylcytosine-specific restriction endonuclease McrA
VLKSGNLSLARCWDCHRAKNREAQRRFRENNGDRAREIGRNTYARNREKRKAAVRAYRVANPEKRAAMHRLYRARKRSAPGKHAAEDVAAQHKRQKGRCYWCGKRVGRKYHVDHVIPLIHGGSNGPENLVIACEHCNTSKSGRHPMDFAGRMC